MNDEFGVVARRSLAGNGVDHRSRPSTGGAETRRSEAWRADIDGLRAVAVLAVIVFHLRRKWLPGGFAGVDVFFVISGFLITRAVLADLAGGRFSRAEFYRRRVRRISLPMLAVVFATVVVAQSVMLPKDALATAWSGIAAVLSVANVWCWKWLDRGYFAPGSDEVPLLHLWSLGVEEQFYFAWPWVVPWLWRRLSGREPAEADASTGAGIHAAKTPAPDTRPSMRAAAVLSVVALASFALGSALFPGAPWFTYYMLPTRAGELLVGATLAFAVASGALAAPGRPLREAAGAVGAVLVLGSFALLSENDPFPGWRAIPPTLGAGLVLVSGQGEPSLVSRFLSVGPLVAIGLVSYSAYLWHWPLIAFWRYGFRDVGNAAALGIFIATFALAAASLRWIERPARRTTRSPGSVAIRQWVLPGAVVVVASLVAIATAGFGPRLLSASYVDRLADFRDELRPAIDFDFVCQFGRIPRDVAKARRCVNGSPGSPAGVLLLGDSNAAHFVGMLDVISRAAGFRFMNVESFACPPLFESPGRFAMPLRRADCDASGTAWRSIVPEFPVVVLAGMWSAYAENPGFFQMLFEQVRGLLEKGHRVILLGQVPTLPKSYDPDCPAKALSFPGLSCPVRVEAPVPPWVIKVNARLREFAERTPGVEYFDATSELCPGGKCSSRAPDGTTVYRDAMHVTMSGSRRLGEELLRNRGVPKPFDQVPSWLAEAARREDRPAGGSAR